jgi:hypothetical protein
MTNNKRHNGFYNHYICNYMQLYVTCNYPWCFMQLQLNFEQMLVIFATMLWLRSLSYKQMDDFYNIKFCTYNLYIPIVAHPTKMVQLWWGVPLGFHCI